MKPEPFIYYIYIYNDIAIKKCLPEFDVFVGVLLFWFPSDPLGFPDPERNIINKCRKKLLLIKYIIERIK